MDNPLLALDVKQPDIAGNYIEGQKQGEGLKASRLSALIQGYKAQADQRENDKQNALRQLYQTQGPGIANGDPNALAQLAQTDPNAAQTARASSNTNATSQATLANLQLEHHLKTVQLGGSLAQAIINADPKDQPALYAQMNQQLEQLNPGSTANAPKEWNPDTLNAVKAMSARALTAEQQITNARTQDAQDRADAQAPFHPDGTPNLAVQEYNKSLKTAGPQVTLQGKEESGATVLTDPTNGGKPYIVNTRTPNGIPKVTDLQGNPYVPGGAGKPSGTSGAQAFSPTQAKFFAEQALSGDTSVYTTIGRNQAGRTQVAQTVADLAQERGIKGADLAAINAAFLGDKQAQRTIGQRTGAIAVSGEEAKNVAGLVKEAYDKLPRGQFRPFNQLRSMWDNQTNSPEQGQAYAADFSLVTAYARALNPQGVPRESDIAKAEQLLNGADSIQKHDAVVDQWLKEIDAIKSSTGTARTDAINRIRKQGGLDALPTTGAASPAGGNRIHYDAQGNPVQ